MQIKITMRYHLTAVRMVIIKTAGEDMEKRELSCTIERKWKWETFSHVLLFVCDPPGLYSPWNSQGHYTGVGSPSLLQGIFPTLDQTQVSHIAADSLPAEPQLVGMQIDTTIVENSMEIPLKN